MKKRLSWISLLILKRDIKINNDPFNKKDQAKAWALEHTPFSFMNLTYDPTYLTILSALAGPFFTTNMRLTISTNASWKAFSPTNFNALPFLPGWVTAAALVWSLYRATQFFLWFARDDCACSNMVAIDSCKSSRFSVDFGAMRRLDKVNPEKPAVQRYRWSWSVDLLIRVYALFLVACTHLIYCLIWFWNFFALAYLITLRSIKNESYSVRAGKMLRSVRKGLLARQSKMTREVWRKNAGNGETTIYPKFVTWYYLTRIFRSLLSCGDDRRGRQKKKDQRKDENLGCLGNTWWSNGVADHSTRWERDSA